MRKTLAILVTAFALTTWSVAQQMQTTDSSKSSSQGFVSGPTVDAKDTSATIRWETEDRAATFVKYGTDKNNLDKEARHSGGARHHNVTLAQLKPGTKYFYEIRKMDGSVRGGGEFTTQGSGSASSSDQSSSGSSSGSSSAGSSSGSSQEDRVVITEGPAVQPGANGTAKIVWKTDDVAATDVKYGTDANNPQQRAFTPGGTRDHQAELKNLQAGQTYYFQILRRDGSVRTTGQFQYQPSAATAATPGPAGSQQQSPLVFSVNPALDTVGDRSATITWGTNAVGSSVIRYGTDQANLNQTAHGQWGTNHSVTLTNLNPNTRYHFRVVSSPAPGTGVDLESGFGSFTTVPPGAQAKKNPPMNQ